MRGLRKFAAPFAALTLLGTGLAVTAASPPVGAAGGPVYSAIPAAIPGNVPSVGFEATSMSEFGDEVGLASHATTLSSARVLMSSWGCGSGSWTNGTCVTTAGTTFSEPITFNVYAVNAGHTVGALLASKTQTFNIPYRPSADLTNCTGANAVTGAVGANTGKWFDGSTCFNGFATPITFDFTTGPAVLLPTQVIWTVAYNTSDYGSAPYGSGTACHSTSGGCGYDSLNVGTFTSNNAGTDTDPDGAFQRTTFAGFYCDNGAGGVGTLRLDTGVPPNCTAGNDWTGFTPAGELTLAGPPGPPHIGAAVGPGDGSADVSFTPGSTGYASGAAFTSFHVSCQSSNGGASGAASGPGSPIHVSGLTNGKTYTCTVTETNVNGTSAASNSSQSFVPVGSGGGAKPPGAPNHVKARKLRSSAISVTFNGPSNNGGAKVTRYSAVCSSANGGVTKVGSRANPPGRPIAVLHLTAGKTYTCVVKATNSAGVGPASSPSNAVTV